MSVTPERDPYRHAVLFDLVRDHRIGLTLAFYRTFAVPRIAELLRTSGEIQRSPHKRSMDTGLFIYEVIEAGLDSERGRRVVTALNRMHRRWPISDEDYRYVLTTFIVVPTRWVARYGARELTACEVDAAVRFYAELGTRMGIPDPPASYADAERLLDDYERRWVGYSDAGRDLMAATGSVLADQLPTALRPVTGLLTRLLLDDHVAVAVGLAPAPRTARRLMRLAAWARRRWAPHDVRTQSWFRPGRPVSGVYPDGYELDDLGPRDPARPAE